MSSQQSLRITSAIELTLRSIEQRARLYRNLVIAVSVVLVGSVVASVALRSWSPVAGLILLVPATAFYLRLDARIVRKWQAAIQNLCDTNGIEVELLSKVLRSHPYAPKATVEAMLQQLAGAAAITQSKK